jgi:predicted transcriptional regulator of viral defense system
MSTIGHMANRTARDRTLNLIRRRGLVSAREIGRHGIHTEVLTRLVAEGELERAARGVYRVAEHDPTQNHNLAIAAAAVPRGIVCLVSALLFHDVGTQLPNDVWLALDRRARRPSLHFPRLRVVRFSGAALTAGVQVHRIEGRDVRVFSVAKTIADCFKYRNKVGLGVALEALKDAWRDKKFTMDELDRYARICRVSRVMGPYVETLVA